MKAKRKTILLVTKTKSQVPSGLKAVTVSSRPSVCRTKSLPGRWSFVAALGLSLLIHAALFFILFQTQLGANVGLDGATSYKRFAVRAVKVSDFRK